MSAATATLNSFPYSLFAGTTRKNAFDRIKLRPIGVEFVLREPELKSDLIGILFPSRIDWKRNTKRALSDDLRCRGGTEEHFSRKAYVAKRSLPIRKQ